MQVIKTEKAQGRQTGGVRLMALVLISLLAMSGVAAVWAQNRATTVRSKRLRRAASTKNRQAATSVIPPAPATPVNVSGQVAPPVAMRGQVISVNAKGDLQQALNQSQPGDVIELEAGATFLGPFTLPVKSGEAYITVQSAQLARLPGESERVLPSHAPLMAKILSPGKGEPALRTAPGAHHFRFIGLEFAPVDRAAVLYHVVGLGDVGPNQDTLEEVPHHFIFDRCYIHAHPQQDLRRGIMLNSAHTDILNSYLSDFKSRGADSQAIGGWNGPGPYRIINNYLEGAGENILFGGADPSIPNLVPSDIEIRHNHLAKPILWRAEDWTVKNLFELKNARRVTVEGNLLEYNWGQSQTGEAILLTVRNQDGKAPWSVVEDVTFINNVVRHTGGGINLLGYDYFHPSQQTKRITIRNNLFLDVSAEKWNGKGEFLLISDRVADVVIDHNTVLQSGSVLVATGGPSTNFTFTNNVISHNQYGLHGDGTGSGNHTLETYFPGAVVRSNVIAGAAAGKFPAGNFYPPGLAAAGFVDPDKGDYHLRTDSTYRGRAADGKDVGCDVDALAAALHVTLRQQLFPKMEKSGL